MTEYELTPKAKKIIDNDRNLQMNIAIVMGNSYMATHLDLQRGGRAIVRNYDALNYLIETLQMDAKQIRIIRKKSNSKP